MKVSVVTATHNRHHLLPRAMKSLADQTFKDWEHIIVSDGSDPQLQSIVEETARKFKQHPYRVVELGRNWHSVSNNVNFGGIPRLVGTYLASGDYIAYLDDDNEYHPNHLTDLVKKIEEGFDFVYGIAEIVRQDKSFIQYLGDGKPRFGAIDTSMVLHRYELLRLANWSGEAAADDWTLFGAWIEANAKVGWIPKLTLRYYRKH